MILGILWKYNNNFNNFLLGIPSMGIVSYGFASENNEILMLFHQFIRGKLSNNFPVFVFVCLFIYYYHSQIRIYNRMCKYGSSHIRLVFDFHGIAWEERGTQRVRESFIVMTELYLVFADFKLNSYLLATYPWYPPILVQITIYPHLWCLLD